MAILFRRPWNEGAILLQEAQTSLSGDKHEMLSFFSLSATATAPNSGTKCFTEVAVSSPRFPTSHCNTLTVCVLYYKEIRFVFLSSVEFIRRELCQEKKSPHKVIQKPLYVFLYNKTQVTVVFPWGSFWHGRGNGLPAYHIPRRILKNLKPPHCCKKVCVMW